jgi:hypothetical protein
MSSDRQVLDFAGFIATRAAAPRLGLSGVSLALVGFGGAPSTTEVGGEDGEAGRGWVRIRP